jgi:hypothetical protein
VAIDTPLTVNLTEKGVSRESARQNAMAKKPFIFFCDDKPKWTDKFKERHGNDFDIVTTNESNNFVNKLAELIKAGRVPDIILIDLYHPRDNENEELRRLLNQEGQAAINRLTCAIIDEKVHVLNAWQPLGYSMLEQARKLCPNTPIAIYTEMGLTLANNDELDKVSKAKGEWFMKGTEGLYEDDRLRCMLNTNLYDKITRHTLWTLAVTIIVAVAVYLVIVKKELDFSLSLVTTLTSIAVAVMPKVISYLVRRKK